MVNLNLTFEKEIFEIIKIVTSKNTFIKKFLIFKWEGVVS